MRPAAILQWAGKPHCMEGKSIHSIMDLPTRGTTGWGLGQNTSDCTCLLQQHPESLVASQNASPAAQGCYEQAHPCTRRFRT